MNSLSLTNKNSEIYESGEPPELSLSLVDCDTKLEQSLMDEKVNKSVLSLSLVKLQRGDDLSWVIEREQLPVNSLSLAELPRAESKLVEISKRNLKQNSVPVPDRDIVGQEFTRVSWLSEPPVAPD